ncbi:MAG: radical SAM protein [Alphaproteobacteria bacterium]|nr:radical SAM protein [Alphaproteobacteria bacterium]MCB9798039.1 radical SAM protein [Alphaproteobacteria bacterium]
MATHEPPLARYAARYAREGAESLLLSKKPLFLTVFVTSRCALNCGHCFYREELQNGDASKEMSLAEFDRMTSRLPHFPKLIITGGEPFLRKDLKDITALFHDNASQARQITIPTAGYHTDRIVQLVEEVLLPRPELILEIQLSIDGVGEQHDSIRGKGSFERLMRTYRALKPIQDANEGLRIRFNYTFSRVTQGWFADTHRFVTEELGNPHFDMVLVRRATIEDDFAGQVDIELYREATRLLQAQEMKKARGSVFKELLAQRVIVEREIIANHHANRRVMGSCTAGTLTAIISEEGELRPCEILDTSFGNLRDNDFDFDALWSSGLAEAHRRFVKETGCFCTFETCVRTTMSFQPRWYGHMAAHYLRDKLRPGT